MRTAVVGVTLVALVLVGLGQAAPETRVSKFKVALKPIRAAPAPSATFTAKVYGGTMAFTLGIRRVPRATAVAYIQLAPHPGGLVRPERYTICGWFHPATSDRDVCRSQERGVFTNLEWIRSLRSHGALVVVATARNPRALVARITPATFETNPNPR